MSQPIDYEKQFQDDLEKAQALSLESLALDKFRMQKKLEKLQIQISKTSETTSNEPIVDNIPQTENAQIISRPRPGSFNTGQPKSILAPPPISQRRNSTTSVSSSFLGTEETDLISFTSPTPAQSSFKELCDEIQKLNQQVAIPPKNNIYKTNMNFATSHPSTFQQVNNTASAPTQQASFINIPQAPNYGFQSHITAGLSLMPGVKPINQSYMYPSLTPQIPPLPSNYTPCNESQLCLPSTSNISNSNVDILKALSKQNNSNLIDLTPSNINNRSNKNNDAFKNSVRVSVLEIFDPLLTTVNSSKEFINKENIVDDTISECSGSMYDEYDPFDYLHSNKSDAGSNSDPIYAAVVKSDKVMLSPQSPPPLPPRASWTTLERKKNTIAAYEKKKYRLYENVTVVKHKMVYEDCEIGAFYQMVKTVREKFVHTDESTNPGLIISPTISNRYKEGTSIKITVYPMIENADVLVKQEPPVSFTCDVSCSVEHVTVHVLCELDMSPEEKHVLQVWGATEYLAPETTLADYEYVHQCIKLEKDIMFSLVPERYVDYSLKRTLQDDKRDNNLKFEELLNNEPVLSISYDALKILLETLEMEMEKIESIAADFNYSRQSTTSTLLQPAGVVQSVKAVCTLMGTVETPDITEALEMFISGCMQFVPAMEIRRTNVLSEDGDYSVVALKNNNSSKEFTENIVSHCERIRAAVQGLIEMYCNAFRVDFKLNSNIEPGLPTICVSEVLDTILIRVCALHRIPSSWKHADYVIGAQVYHGTRPVGSPVLSLPTPSSHNFYTRVVFNSWLDMEGMSICRLAREARLVLVLYGRTLIPPEKDDTNAPPKYEQEELCWGAVQFFNYEGVLTQGGLLLSLWPSVADKRLGPAPYLGSHPLSDHPLLGIELPGPATRVLFPPNPPQSPNEKIPRGEFSSLDDNTQQLLLDFIDHDMFSKLPVESREVLWEKRHYLYHLPLALPKVLLAAHSWDWACLADLHAMLHSWAPMQPVQSLQLLLPCFPDIEVRRCAMHWMKELSNDELIDYLPQLVQALKYETYDASALARFLLDRALMSPRVAHHLYWLLAHNLPGQFPQNSTWDVTTFDEVTVSAARYYRRITLMLRALLAISGKSLRHRFMSQQILVKNLQEVAENIQQTKESLRLKTLCTALDNIHQSLEDNPTCLPLSPGLLVSGIQVWTSSYFPSNTLPLKINFIAPDTTIIPAIFKVGDDLQQDMLTLQMVRIMDKLWLREGLDLKMVAFGCMPTGFKRGMIEMVTEAETLRKIQVEWGLTGSFKDKPIAEWLAKHNPTELEYGRAVENFTASCAGYSVVTYLLGICDRHNDNIMLKTSGHMFHIDFGKFLGDAQMFGNFKRDRAPFVLTSDMVYVINGGDRPSARFHHFVDLCCQAFNIVRRHGNLILLLLALMASSGIPGVTMDAVTFVSKGLMLEKSNAEAASLFARLIESSLKSKFTQFNFFLHNLAQLRFTGDHTDGELLSFVPKTYSVAMDGRLSSVQVLGYQKRYDPDKHYVYIIGIERLNQPDPSYVLRSYKEFTEFHQKLCLHFPLAKIYSLPTGLHMGRSNIKQVAAKRKTDIELFLKSLFLTADEIAHSELVYTFFHPLLRDQQPIDINCKKLKEKRVDERSDIGRVKGELKLSVIYERGVLSVMVQHARNLPLIAGGQEPSTYVKVYLLPDPSKATKRKTLVVKRSCHPTFMEMLEYRLPLDLIKHRLLQATIWNHDPLQENEFLGGVELRLWEMPLEQEETHWFPLNNITRK